MSYTDYLPTHDYDQLPDAVRNEISRDDYTTQRSIVLGLGTEAMGLPPALRVAFRQERPLRVASRRWSLAAAAGWLLFLLAGLGWLFTPARTVTETEYVTVEREVAGPERVVRDTVYRTIELPPKLLVQTDTVYLDQPANPEVSGSRSLADRPGLLELLSED